VISLPRHLTTLYGSGMILREDQGKEQPIE
jgi:hypothetical protein